MKTGAKKSLTEFHHFFDPLLEPNIRYLIRYLILEDYLLDFLNPTPNALAVVNKAFSTLLKSDGFALYFAKKYFPFLADAPEFFTKPMAALMTRMQHLFSSNTTTVPGPIIPPNISRKMMRLTATGKSLQPIHINLYLKWVSILSQLSGLNLGNSYQRVVDHFHNPLFGLNTEIYEMQGQLNTTFHKMGVEGFLSLMDPIEQLQKKARNLANIAKAIQIAISETGAGRPALKEAENIARHFRACQHPDLTALEKLPNWNFDVAMELADQSGNIKLALQLLNPENFCNPRNISHIRWAFALDRVDRLRELVKDDKLSTPNPHHNLILHCLNQDNVAARTLLEITHQTNVGNFIHYSPTLNNLECWDLSKEFSQYSVVHFENILRCVTSIFAYTFLITQILKTNRADLIKITLKQHTFALEYEIFWKILCFATNGPHPELVTEILLHHAHHFPGLETLRTVFITKNAQLICLALKNVVSTPRVYETLEEIFKWAAEAHEDEVQMKILQDFPLTRRSDVIRKCCLTNYAQSSEEFYTRTKALLLLFLKEKSIYYFSLQSLIAFLKFALQREDWEVLKALLTTTLSTSTFTTAYLALIASFSHKGKHALETLLVEKGRFCTAFQHFDVIEGMTLACRDFPPAAIFLLDNFAEKFNNLAQKLAYLTTAHQSNHPTVITKLLQTFHSDYTYQNVGTYLGYDHALVKSLFPHLTPPSLGTQLINTTLEAARSYLPSFLGLGAPRPKQPAGENNNFFFNLPNPKRRPPKC